MAVTDNVAAMIDYLVLRHKLNAASDRARILAQLQASEESLWSMRQWYFRQREETFQTALGTAVYTLTEPCNNILQICDENGQRLTFIDPDVFAQVYRAQSAVVGTPTCWSFITRESQDNCTFQLYATPDSAMTMSAVKETRANTLEDSSGSQSAFPPMHRMIVCTNAMQRLMRLGSQVQNAQDIDAEYEQLLAALIAEDAMQAKAMR